MPETKSEKIGKRVLDVRTNAPEVVRKAMKARGYTNAMLAEAIGYSGQNAISMALNGRNTRIDVMFSFLDEMGFDIIVKDRNGSNRGNVWKIERMESPETGGGE